MKPKKTLFVVLLLMVLFSTTFHAQTYESGPWGGVSDAQVKRQIYSDGNSSFFLGYPNFYGYTAGSTSVLIRSVWSFNLPQLPKGAYLTSINLYYKNCSSSNGNFKVYLLPISSWTSGLPYPQVWDLTENATYIASLSCNSTGYSADIYNGREQIRSAISTGQNKIFLSVRASSESGSTNISPGSFDEFRITYNYIIKVNHIIKNSFTDGIEGGVINIFTSGVPITPTSTSGYNLAVQENTPIILQAVDQPFENYDRIWHYNVDQDKASKWIKVIDNVEESSYGKNLSYTANKNEIDVTYTAYLKKLYHVNFASSASAPFSVNGIPYSGTTPNIDIVELNKITFSANDYVENNILFVADHWDYGTYVSAGTWEWYPAGNVTNSLHYKGRPMPYDRNLHFNSYNQLHPNTRVKLYWNAYPNPDVKYQIWRKVYQNNNLIQTAKLATLNNSITTYTDYDYYIRPAGEGDVDLSYDVRTVYTPS